MYIVVLQYPPTPADSRGSASEKQRPATSAMQCEGGAREDRRGSYLRDEGGENRRVAGEASCRGRCRRQEERKEVRG